MKKLLMVAMAVLVFAGCHTIPSESTVSVIAKTTGMAAGYACQLAEMDPEVQTTVTDIMNMVKKVTPDEHSSCYDCWMPIITAELDKLEAEGKINSVQKSLSLTVLTLSAEGVDYMLNKNPKWKQYANLVTVAISSFCDGFTQVMGISKNGLVSKNPDVDMDTYMYLRMRYEIIKQNNVK